MSELKKITKRVKTKYGTYDCFQVKIKRVVDTDRVKLGQLLFVTNQCYTSKPSHRYWAPERYNAADTKQDLIKKENCEIVYHKPLPRELNIREVL